MRITKVTFTGIDDQVLVKDISALSKHYDFIEWGILFSKNREGQQRYPTEQKRLEFANAGLNLSAHFCGWYSKEVLERKNYSLLNSLYGFKRVQLNYNFEKSTGWDVRPLLEWVSDHDQLAVIFQVNGANQKTIDYIDSIETPQNVHFLYDSSGGRRKVIGSVKKPYKTYTGYSGGIDPENANSITELISNYSNPAHCWIDMESGVRTNDQFDLDKVSKIIHIVENYITQTY
jgi:hypothetical protein